MTLEEMIEDAVLAEGPSVVPESPARPGGVDPLGLRQINFGLMDAVFPNLNNVARRLRPFVVLAWAWRRVGQLVKASGAGGETDERMRDFVDRIEAIYSWSQFLIDPSPGIPGGQALQPVIASERYRFGGDAWIARRNLRRSSTGLVSPLNYGPGLKLMGWVEEAGARGVFHPNPWLDPALDAFEATIKSELDHPAFSQMGEVVIEAADVRRWGALWALPALTPEEQEAGFERLAGTLAPVERREGIELTCAAFASLGRPDADPNDVRRRMAEPLATWTDKASLKHAADRWRKVQVRQVFRLALEGMLHWLIGELDVGPMQTTALAEAFLAEVGQGENALNAAEWLASRDFASNPVDHLGRLRVALDSGNGTAAAIADALAFSLREAPPSAENFEVDDRLPLTRAAAQAQAWARLTPAAFVAKAIDTWILAQHAYWCVGRGLADARGRGKNLLRLKVVMDEGGWTLTPGAGRGSAPVATPDRLESALGLLAECGRLP